MKDQPTDQWSAFIGTGFPNKDPRFSKLTNIPDLLSDASDEKEGKIIEKYFIFEQSGVFYGKPCRLHI